MAVKYSGNLGAFLDTIKHSELGDDLIAASDRGYNVIVGSTASKPILVKDYHDHPHQMQTMVIKGRSVTSSAAGGFQLLGRYWDVYKVQLELPDFGPASQETVAVQQIQECKALGDINAGRFYMAAQKCSRIWASLPGATYNQHVNDLGDLRAFYVRAGGKLTP